MPLTLTPDERAMLSGAHGPGVRRAMDIVVALGRIYGAERLVKVGSVQVAGVSYRNLGEAGLEFLRNWASEGARTRVPTTLNPAGIDLEAWRELGFSERFAQRQQAVIDAYRGLGARTTCTCTPYLVGTVPRLGEHVAWAESSAVSYANSVLGARTNREGGPSALAAAITGRTAAYGLHLDRNRAPTLRVVVTCPIRTLSDLGALGYLVGQEASNDVPYFVGFDVPGGASGLKALGAAMAGSGAVALYHFEGVTPEDGGFDLARTIQRTLVVEDLQPGYDALHSGDDAIDLVWLGCPHADLAEIAEVARRLDGRPVASALWITTARATRRKAVNEGYVRDIESAGGRVVADMCVAIAPMHELGYRTIATPSAKGAHYAAAHAGLNVYFGSVSRCVDAAMRGTWR
jgi:predicted aconitase